MEGIKRVLLRSGSPAMMLVMLLISVVLVMLPGISATRWRVGDQIGWTTNLNYSTWTKDKHFYNGDWLFFVYDRNHMNVLEVNKTDYETCNYEHPLHSWTNGAGRDVVPLNVTRSYYFVGGKGFCFGGMKIAIHVEDYPHPPIATHVENQPLPAVTAQERDVGAATWTPSKLDSGLSAIGEVWDAFIHYFW